MWNRMSDWVIEKKREREKGEKGIKKDEIEIIFKNNL